MSLKTAATGFLAVLAIGLPCRAADAESPDAVTARHFRSIHAGLVRYLEKHNGVWPQTPRIVDQDFPLEQKWWIQTLEPFGVKAEDWTDPREEGKEPEGRMAYTVFAFGLTPRAAALFPDQPWIMTSAPSKTSGEFHLLLSGGRVINQTDYLNLVQKKPLADGVDKTTVEHLFTIHRGVIKYLKAHDGIWPQPPEDLDPDEEQKWFEKLLEPYGIKTGDWADPSPGPPGSDDDRLRLSLFDKEPFEAFAWLSQPWIVTNRLNPCLLVFPDGRVLTAEEAARIAGKG